MLEFEIYIALSPLLVRNYVIMYHNLCWLNRSRASEGLRGHHATSPQANGTKS